MDDRLNEIFQAVLLLDCLVVVTYDSHTVSASPSVQFITFFTQRMFYKGNEVFTFDFEFYEQIENRMHFQNTVSSLESELLLVQMINDS